MRIFCFTSDRHQWALRAFAHQHNLYWRHPVVVVGFTPPEFELPKNFSFVSVGKFGDYPVERWSDAVIKFLKGIDDKIFAFMFEDYWLLRAVDRRAVNILEDYCLSHRDVARMDMTRDRANNAEIRHAGYAGHLDLVESTPEIVYHFSTQAAIWRREMFLDILRPGETPWETELNGQERLANAGYRVMGTRQCPVKYLIALQSGKLALDGGYQGAEYALPEADRRELEELGYLEASHG